MRYVTLALVLIVGACTNLTPGGTPTATAPDATPTTTAAASPTASATLPNGSPTTVPTPTATATAGATGTPGTQPTPTASAPTGVLVHSPDGVVTLEIPIGAAPAGTEVTIEQRAADQAPPELVAVNIRPSHYALLPEGTTFSQPVRVTQRVPLAQVTRPEGISLILQALRSAAGIWTWLQNQTITIAGDMVVVSGTTDHLAGLYRWTDRTELVILPPAPRTDFVNAQFVRGLELVSRDTRANPIAYVDGSIMYQNLSPQIIGIDQPRDFPTESDRRWTCLAPGDYTVIFQADLANFARDNPFWQQTLKLGPTPGKAQVELRGECLAEPPLELEAVCVRVVHESFGTFLSFLDFFLEVFSDEEIEYFEVVMESVQDGMPFRLELNADGAWNGRGGLRGAGPKRIVSVVVHFENGDAFEITPLVTDALGTDTLDVRHPEEDFFGDCD